MDAEYIKKHIYPLVKIHSLEESRKIWFEIIGDPLNPHLQDRATAKVKEIDENIALLRESVRRTSEAEKGE